MPDPVHISSLLLRASPDRLGDVLAALEQYEEAEIAHADDVGRIIVTLETASESRIVDAMTEMQLISGVVSAALVYHQVDSDADDAASPSKETMQDVD